MGSPWAPLCDIALTTTLLQFEETSGPADVALEELAKPVLVQIALPNADSADVDPSICLQAGIQGRVAIICIPVVAYAPIQARLIGGAGSAMAGGPWCWGAMSIPFYTIGIQAHTVHLILRSRRIPGRDASYS
jgi:hypothetical protein